MTQHDYVISDAPGQPIRLDLQAALQALVSLNAGTTAPAAPYGGMMWLDTSVLPDGQLRMRNQANNAWIAIAGFPAKASSAEVIAGIDDAKFVTSKGLADSKAVLAQLYRNRISNPAMQISQEWGSSALAGSGSYPADEWRVIFSGGAHSYAQTALTTPKGSKYRLRNTVTTAAAAAAGNFLSFYQVIEGFKIADFMFGTANARRAILRFGFKGPAGTYSCSLRNGAGNRTYLKNFTISAGQANVDTEQVFVIPGDVTGTWPIDATAAMLVTVTAMCGATYQGAADVWQAGNFVGTAVNGNSLLLGAVFDVFDVGLYVDALGNGIPPLWEMPDEPEELVRMCRYFCADHQNLIHTPGTIGNGYYALSLGPCEMRSTSPAYSGVSQGNQGVPAAAGTFVAYTPSRIVRESRTCNSTTVVYWETKVTANARFA